MPVMAINMLMANMIQLICENRSSNTRTDDEVVVRDALSKIIVRLEIPANYNGQAGCNLYETVSTSLAAPKFWQFMQFLQLRLLQFLQLVACIWGILGLAK